MRLQTGCDIRRGKWLAHFYTSGIKGRKFMNEIIRKLAEDHGMAAVLWALHDLVDTKKPVELWTDIEIKLAECAESAQEIEGKK
jgi:hypothetical protein